MHDTLTREALARYNLTIPQKEAALLVRLVDLLLAGIQKMNLTAIRDKDGILEKHILDSLSVLPYIPSDATTLLDVGSGAGFPALPIAIMRPDITVVALEATNKKAAFIEATAATLGLSNVQVVAARAEDAGCDAMFRGRFDVVVARALAALPILLEYTMPFVKNGGILLAMKTKTEPITALPLIAEELGGTFHKSDRYTVPGTDDRVILKVKKTVPTARLYPRREAQIRAHPLG